MSFPRRTPSPSDSDGANWPLAYLLTWRTYGTWQPGDPRGSTSRHIDGPHDNSFISPQQEAAARKRLKHGSVLLSTEQRRHVEQTVEETALHAGWNVVAKNARTNHVHVVITAQMHPEPLMNSLKSWATRRLRETGLLDEETKPWGRHGSTHYLWTDEEVRRAAAYVLEAQDGERFDRDA